MTPSSVADELYHNEELASQPFASIGIYSGNVKLSSPYDNVILHLTTHRILLSLPSSSGTSASASSSPSSYPTQNGRRTILHSLTLDRVRQTEFYAGFLKSSPKITLTLTPTLPSVLSSSSSSQSQPSHHSHQIPSAPSSFPSASSPYAAASFSTSHNGSSREAVGWPCPLCGFLNPQPAPGSTERTIKCLTCGVSRKDSLFAVPPSSGTPSRSSTPVTTSAPSPPPPPLAEGVRSGSGSAQEGQGGESIACPQCTFLNHPDLPSCEICSFPLPSRRSQGSTKSQAQPSPSPTTSIAQPSPLPTSTLYSQSSSSTSVHTPSPILKDSPSNEPFTSPIVRLSFRKGGAPIFYGLLKSTLSERKWDDGAPRLPDEQPLAATSISTCSASAVTVERAQRGGMGLDRILNTIDLDGSTKSDAIESSMKDLESLMAKAGEMAKLASQLSHKLSLLPPPLLATPAAQSTATLLTTTLQQLGLPPAPSAISNISLSGPALTQDMLSGEERAKEKAYLEGLARELGGVLVGGGRDGGGGLMVGGTANVKGKGKGKEVMKPRGIIGLDEVWCVWNRARGVALISPKTMVSCLSYLPSVTSPSISLREFSSSSGSASTPLRVLHTPYYSPASFRARLLSSLRPDPLPHSSSFALPSTINAITSSSPSLPSISTIELAIGEDISVGIAKAMVEELEATDGSVVRDSQAKSGGGGESWYANLITEAWEDLQRQQSQTHSAEVS